MSDNTDHQTFALKAALSLGIIGAGVYKFYSTKSKQENQENAEPQESSQNRENVNNSTPSTVVQNSTGTDDQKSEVVVDGPGGVLIAGPPGAGKGTACGLLVKRLGLF